MNKRNLIIISAGFIILAVLIVLALSLKNIQKGKKAVSDTTLSLSTLYSQAQNSLAKGNLTEAKLALQKLVNFFPSSSDVMNWQKKMEEINIRLLFSPVITPKSVLYEIKPGDTLTKIAQEFGVSVAALMTLNDLANPNLIHVGHVLKIPKS